MEYRMDPEMIGLLNPISQKTKSKELEETQDEEIKHNRGYRMGR
jgi:hypothetical protein